MTSLNHAKTLLQSSPLTDLMRRNDVVMLGIFGSTAREESGEQSDLDLLVRFGRRKSLLALIRLERELAEALQMPVDLVTEAALSPYLQPEILNDLQVVYEA